MPLFCNDSFTNPTLGNGVNLETRTEPVSGLTWLNDNGSGVAPLMQGDGGGHIQNSDSTSAYSQYSPPGQAVSTANFYSEITCTHSQSLGVSGQNFFELYVGHDRGTGATYTVRFDLNGSVVKFFKYTGGGGQVGSLSFTLTAANWTNNLPHTIYLEYVAGSLTCKMDGSTILGPQADSSITTGKFGGMGVVCSTSGGFAFTTWTCADIGAPMGQAVL